MPRYIYSAKSGPYKVVSGEVEAESQQDAISKLNKIKLVDDYLIGVSSSIWRFQIPDEIGPDQIRSSYHKFAEVTNK